MREIVGILERKDTSEGSATTPATWVVMLAVIAMLKYHTSPRDT
jgi:hypothetical protein